MILLGKRWITRLCWILLTLILMGTSGCHRYAHPDLRKELLTMLEQDQRIRQEHQAIFVKTATPPDKVFVPKEELDRKNQELFEKMKQLDETHTARMKEIIGQYGWPGYNLVGQDGSQAAWVLVQHSGDLEFQKRCLELLTEAASGDDASWGNVAYLTDRILVAKGKPQVYGTQFRPEQGQVVPFPIENEEQVNQRRAEVGLPSLEEYREMMNQHLKNNQ